MIILIMLIFTIIFIAGFYLVDLYLTRKRVSKNQREWDEYSKGMTDQEKMACFFDFLYRQKVKYNWNYLYIPWYRGSKEASANDD